VSFVAYPGMPSDLVRAGCEVHVLAERGFRRTGTAPDRRGRAVNNGLRVDPYWVTQRQSAWGLVVFG